MDWYDWERYGKVVLMVIDNGSASNDKYGVGMVVSSDVLIMAARVFEGDA